MTIMNKCFITVLTVNYNSADFIINTLHCLEGITKKPYKVIVADNNSRIEDYKKLKKFCDTCDNVVLYRKENFDLVGSMAHGTTLNELVKMVDTPYFSILDADATWLADGWDEKLINRFTNKIKIIGTQAPGSKPQDFPLMFAALFETETFNKLDIDFRPKDIQKKLDTGHEMRGKYLSNGYEGLNIIVKNTRVYKDGPFSSLVGVAEYYLDGSLFASHFGRGSTLGANKYQKGWKRFIYKIPFLGKWILERKGKNEKRAWIRICKTIVS